eukprot:20109-Heterococcus_DN1.PRE.2
MLRKRSVPAAIVALQSVHLYDQELNALLLHAAVPNCKLTIRCICLSFLSVEPVRAFQLLQYRLLYA